MTKCHTAEAFIPFPCRWGRLDVVDSVPRGVFSSIMYRAMSHCAYRCENTPSNVNTFLECTQTACGQPNSRCTWEEDAEDAGVSVSLFLRLAASAMPRALSLDRLRFRSNLVSSCRGEKSCEEIDIHECHNMACSWRTSGIAALRNSEDIVPLQWTSYGETKSHAIFMHESMLLTWETQ